MSAIYSRIEKLLIKQGLSAREITPDANFHLDLGFDSLDQAELIMTLESAFDLKIPDAEAAGLKTVGEVAAYLERKLAVQAAGA